MLQADPLSDEWKAYSEYIDHMISDGLFKAIKCSLQYLIESTETTSRSTPLFEVQLILDDNGMNFKPSLDCTIRGNFSDIVESLIQNIYLIASNINRVAKHLGQDTYQVLLPLFSLSSLLATVSFISHISGMETSFSFRQDRFK